MAEDGQTTAHGQTHGSDERVGILTGARRDVWAAARSLLAKGSQTHLTVCLLAKKCFLY